MKRFFLLLALLGCASTGHVISSDFIKQNCPTGPDAKYGKTIKVQMRAMNGSEVFLCGYINKKLAANLYDMSEFNIYYGYPSREKPEHLLKTYSYQGWDVEVDERNARMLLTRYAMGDEKIPLYSQELQCRPSQCDWLEKKCLFSGDSATLLKPLTGDKAERAEQVGQQQKMMTEFRQICGQKK